MPGTRPAGRFDGGGPVVGREPIGGREPGGVTDVAEDEPGHDRADAVHLEQRRPRGLDGVGDPLPCGGDLPIPPADSGQQLEGEAFALDSGDTIRVDGAQQFGGPVGAEPSWGSTSDELPQRHTCRPGCAAR